MMSASKGVLYCSLAALALAGMARGQVSILPPTTPVMEVPAAPSGVATPVPLAGRPWVYTADAEFLLWLTQAEGGSRAVSLQGPATIPTDLSVGNGNTKSPIPGARFTFGVWVEDTDPVLDPEPTLHAYGAETRFTFLSERGAEIRGAYAVTGLGRGEIVGDARFSIWGVEANGRCNVYNNAPGQSLRVDLLGGVRYMNFYGALDVARRTTFDANVAGFPAFQQLAGVQVDQRASYRAYDHFVGGQIGLSGQFFACQNVLIGSDVRLALGPDFKRVTASGAVVTTPDRSALLAGTRFPADSGSFSRTKFNYLPEGNLYVKVNLCQNLSGYAGYSLLYWSKLARAADQVELGAPSGLLSTTEVIRDRGLLLHAFFLGMELVF